MYIFFKSCSCSFFFFSCSISFILAGCVHNTPIKPIEPPSALARSGLPFESSSKSTGFYRKQVKKWQAISEKETDPVKQADAHLHLASLYLNQNNPGKNYHKASFSLSHAVKLWPDLQNHVAIVSWLELLKSYEKETQSLQKKLAGMRNSLDSARKQIGTQRHSIVTLQESIEKLKRADMVVEKKRRAFR